MFAISISVSQYPVGLSEAYGILFGHLGGYEPRGYEEALKDRIVWEMNMPRALGGIMIGAILAIGGAVMQSALRNPLADPYTTGISSGAMFGVALYVVMGVTILPFASPGASQMANAFAFALIPAAIMLFLSAFRNTSSTMMILIGIGVMYIFSASVSLMKFTADPRALEEVYVWGVGSIGKVGWGDVAPLAAALMAISAAMAYLSKSINVLSSGDKLSSSLGVRPVRLRMICLAFVSVSVAAAVCFSGTIGFVGLVAPHVSRILVGSDARRLIPCSAAVGALLLLAADCIARNAGTTGLPVGVVTALIGGPLFLYFLIRQKKGVW
ncbi:MAG: iron ABC transporter permease [Candidatus Methanoplasma sp.]|nr:iron ABC transporter permease [Candidatus Methanoplasma sp.]